MNLKHIKRADHCLNCNTLLNSERDNFCPNCGQVNNVKKETAIGLVRELVEEFLHLDSKVMQSLLPLIIKPGFLTVDYNSGHRAKYFHPVRLFLTITVIMFLLQGFSSHESASGGEKDHKRVLDSSYVYNTETNELTREAVVEDTTRKGRLLFGFGDVSISRDTLQHYLDNGVQDPEILMDTFKIEKTFLNSLFFRQLLKSQIGGFDKLGDYYLHKLPWILFSLMPVFAFILYLFYIRRKIFYVDHLIHAFHLHSAIFLILSLQMLIELLIDVDTFFLTLLIPLYYFISLKKVYLQSWRKTIFKGISIGFCYLILGGMAVFLVSAILFLMI